MNDSTLDSSNYETEYPNDDIGKIGLRDKFDQSSGLTNVNPKDVSITTLEYSLTVDTRDCVGSQSLADAQNYAVFLGIRDSASGKVLSTTGLGVSPITVTISDITTFKNGDIIIINGVRNNTNANGRFTVSNVTTTVSPIGTIDIQGTGNGNYTSGGTWERPADNSYPSAQNFSLIRGNQIIFNMENYLKNVRTFSLYYINIPRDIIPLQVYISDFIPVSTTYNNVVYSGLTETNYLTFIPMEKKYMEQRLLGFYSSPLDLWRKNDGNVALPDQVTPAPLELWNPPLGPWPNGQPISYPFQTVPTYVSNLFTVTNELGFFYLVLAGHGVYDLLDWTIQTGNPVADAFSTSLIRKLLLFLLTPKQSYRDIDYVTLIINCNTVTPGNFIYPFGYGDFQRMVPGPGYQLNYQPGTNVLNPGNPTVASPDSPIPFPNFRGNVCGPYNSPGARFQKLGTRTLVQDLFLNGDLNNLFGDPIILPNVPTESIPNDPTFGLNFLSSIEVNLGNVQNATNLNILNALRITPNGFGAVVVRANGSGTTYQNVYQGTAGGQGPSNLGVPSAWVNRGIYSVAGSYTDPIAQGPFAPGVTAATADANYVGDATVPQILNSTSFNDAGPDNGSFINKLIKFIAYAVNDIPDTDLIIKIEEAERTIRSQSTNSENSYCMLDCPIRLSIGSANGTQEYIESITSLTAGGSFYWQQRYMAPPNISKLHINFFTYDGQPIPLEKMLQQRRTVELQSLTVKILRDLNFPTSPFIFSFLYDPLNPQLIGRVKRYFQIIFKADCYEGVSPGLNTQSYQGITPYIPASDTVKPYN